jgi:hypothetical protein
LRSVGEVVGQHDAPARGQRAVGAVDQVAAPLGALRAAHVAEHDEVVVVVLEVDLVEVAGAQLDPVGDAAFTELARRRRRSRRGDR